MDVTVSKYVQFSVGSAELDFHQTRTDAKGDSMILQQQHQIVVERSFNPNSTVVAFGKTPTEAADKVLSAAREYGYWDVTKTYPVTEAAPDPGTGRR